MKKRTGAIYVGEVGGLPAGEIKCTDDILTATKSNSPSNSTILYTYEDIDYIPFISSITWCMEDGAAPEITFKVISATTSEIYLSNVFGGKCSGRLEITFIQSNIEIDTMIESYDIAVTTISMLE